MLHYVAPPSRSPADGDDQFEMANLYPRHTGLPMTVWVSVKGGAQHDARIKANMAHGNQMDASNTAVFGVRPQPRLLHGQMSTRDTQAVCDWITLNNQVIMDYWLGLADTIELGQRLKPLP